MTNSAENSLIKWEHINQYIIYARSHTRFLRMSFIQCYAVREEHDDSEKDEFYNCLQCMIDRIPKHHLRFVKGDFNARVRRDSQEMERAMVGNHHPKY